MSLPPRIYRPALLLVAISLVAACSSSRYSQRHDSGPSQDVSVAHIPDAVPRHEPRSKYGNPASYSVNGRTYYVKQSSKGFTQRGTASWYGNKFHGHRTSSGETYDMYKMTAAHKTLPLPSYVRVTNLKNNRSVIVKVNDRGPFHEGRIIDLSYAAAKKLAYTAQGTAQVEIMVVAPDTPSTYTANNATQPPPTANTSAPHAVNKHYVLQEHERLFLQVGAFASRDNAELLKKRLLNSLSYHNIQTAFLQDRNLYRVRIGPLANLEQADMLADKIVQLGISTPHIVID